MGHIQGTQEEANKCGWLPPLTLSQRLVWGGLGQAILLYPEEDNDRQLLSDHLRRVPSRRRSSLCHWQSPLGLGTDPFPMIHFSFLLSLPSLEL